MPTAVIASLRTAVRTYTAAPGLATGGVVHTQLGERQVLEFLG